MQVFKTFLKIVKKKMTSVIIYFVVFVGIAIAMAKNGGENEQKNFQAEELNLVIENQDEGKLGGALVDYLGKDNNLIDVPKTEDALLDKIFYRDIDYVLYIPADFTARFTDGERAGLLTDKKVPFSSSGEFADNQIQSYLKTAGIYLDSGYDLSDAIRQTDEDMTVTARTKLIDDTNPDAFEPGKFYFRYLPYIYICMLICAIGPVFMAFHETDLDARNKCSAMSFLSRNVQLILGSVVVSIAIWALMEVVGSILYPGYMFSKTGFWCSVNSMMQILFALACAYTAGQIVTEQQALSMISNFFGLGLAFLGGIFVPIEIFSDSVLRVAKFMPTYWYMMTLEGAQHMDTAGGLPADAIQGLVIQSLFAVAVLLVGMVYNRMKAKA
ncbi:MAG: ABC transporter permease [Lachnospiraceae bacterium]|nr:ABC transporter permease [Lachnospiraceae bacterium]